MLRDLLCVCPRRLPKGIPSPFKLADKAERQSRWHPIDGIGIFARRASPRCGGPNRNKGGGMKIENVGGG